MLLQHHMKIIVVRFHLPLLIFVFSVLCSSLSHSLVLCFLISLPPLYVKFIPPMLSDDVTTLLSSSLFVFVAVSPGTRFVPRQTAVGFPHLQQINIMQDGSLDCIMRREL